MLGRCFKRLAVLAVCMVLSCAAAPSAEANKTGAEIMRAAEAAYAAATPGPSVIGFGGRARLETDERFAFIPKTEAINFLKAAGLPATSDVTGILTPTDGTLDWLVILSAARKGHIPDDAGLTDFDAQGFLDKAARLDQKRNGAEGALKMEWFDPPAYDKAARRLTMGFMSHYADGSLGAEHRTLMLGRDGYVAMMIVEMAERAGHWRWISPALAEGLRWAPGQSYADFDAKTDAFSGQSVSALAAAPAAGFDVARFLIGFFSNAKIMLAMGVMAAGFAASRIF